MKDKKKYFNWIEYVLRGFSCIGCATVTFITVILGLCILTFFIVYVLSGILVDSVTNLPETNSLIIQENVLQEGTTSEKIAVIDITGVITSTSNGLFTMGNMVSEISNALSYASKNTEIKQVVLFIDSPGGGVVESDKIYRQVRDLSQKKRVTAYISSIGASGGYYIAVGTQKIIMHQAGITGSIGVIMSVTNYDQLYEKIGIREKVFKSGRFKDNAELFDKKSDGQLQEMYQNMLDEVYNQFVDIVVINRPLTRQDVLKIADGRVMGAKEAVKQKLIDDVNTFEETLAKIKEEDGIDYKVVRLSTQYSILDQLSRGYNSVQQFFQGNIENSSRLYYLYKN